MTFGTIKGAGNTQGFSVISDGDGIARIAGWTLGRVPGENVLQAQTGSLPAVVFRATGVVGPPVALLRLPATIKSERSEV